MSKTIQLRFGAMVPPLSQQLAGFGLSDEAIEHFQLDADAITRFYIRGALLAAETKKARMRLIKAIEHKMVKP